jgi:hypothetical protein
MSKSLSTQLMVDGSWLMVHGSYAWAARIRCPASYPSSYEQAFVNSVDGSWFIVHRAAEHQNCNENRVSNIKNRGSSDVLDFHANFKHLFGVTRFRGASRSRSGRLRRP